MAEERTNQSFRDSWREFFRQQGWTQREVAAWLGLDESFFSKALRGADYKTLGPEKLEQISELAGLGRYYFPETREAALIEALRADPELRDRLFDELRPASRRR